MYMVRDAFKILKNDSSSIANYPFTNNHITGFYDIIYYFENRNNNFNSAGYHWNEQL